MISIDKIKGWTNTTSIDTRLVWNGDDGDKVVVQNKPNFQGLGYDWIMGAHGQLHIKRIKTKEEAIQHASDYMKARPIG